MLPTMLRLVTSSATVHVVLLAAVIGLCAATGRAQVVISEFMANNNSTLADEDAEYPDWIEIYNPGIVAVDLSGWTLTDDPAALSKWRFPAVTLAPKGFLVVFASGKNRTSPRLHANFSLATEGEYLALVKPDGQTIATEFAPQFPEQYADVSYGAAQQVVVTSLMSTGATARFTIPLDGGLGNSWTAASFADSNWTSVRTGVGYETEVAGFAVQNFKANIVVGNLTAAEGVIANPGQRTRTTAENSGMINYFGSAQDGHYGANRPFPGDALGVDIDDFVVEATGTLTIPAAGDWTFGVNSDDGFSLRVGNFSMSFADPRAPADTLGTFNFPAAGDYPVRLVFYEQGGGSCVELFAAQGSFTVWDSVRFKLVGDAANGGLAVRSPVVGGGTASGGYRPLIATDVQAAMKGRNATAYLRIPFNVQNPAGLEAVSLRVKYDDGFVAYLNGQEIARRNAPAVTAWNSAALTNRPPNLGAVVEEVNLSDRLNLFQTANVLAIQGLNQSANDSDFLLLPELIDTHALGTSAHYFATATPGAFNVEGFVAFVADTKFSHDRGFYDTPFAVTITTATTNATIRYTTNGTPPSLTNGITYTGPLRLRMPNQLFGRVLPRKFDMGASRFPP